MTRQRNTSGQSKKTGFVLQCDAALPGQCRYEVGIGIVASAPVFTTGVAQSSD